MAAVCLTFDFDALSGWIYLSKAKSAALISRGEFEAVATPRILDLLDRYGIPSTWFIPGHTAETYPDLVQEVAKRGHEVGHHGYCHENPLDLDRDSESKIIEKGIEALLKVTGKKPSGYRSPSWEISPNTIELLLQYSFVYDSSLMGNDFTPYWCRRGDICTLDAPYKFGEPINLVEMPVCWHLDDFPYFEFLSLPSQIYPGLRAPSNVTEIWRGDFDYMMANFPMGVYILTLHPQVIGRGHRLILLEELISHMLQTPFVRFERMIDYVRSWKEQQFSQKRFMDSEGAT